MAQEIKYARVKGEVGEREACCTLCVPYGFAYFSLTDSMYPPMRAVVTRVWSKCTINIITHVV